MTRLLSTGGLLAMVAGVLAVALLHVLPPTRELNPVRRTISEYAYSETGWVFNLGLLSLALGSLAVLAALVRHGLTRLASAGGVGLVLWCVGLVGIVWFPKHDWSVGPSTHGSLHRVASLVAFVALPVAAVAIGGAWRRHERWRGYAWATVASAMLAMLCFTVILGAYFLQPVTGEPWWRVIPLGAVERSVALAEVITMFTLGFWALSIHSRPRILGPRDRTPAAHGDPG